MLNPLEVDTIAFVVDIAHTNGHGQMIDGFVVVEGDGKNWHF